MQKGWTDRRILKKWRNRCARAALAHYASARRHDLEHLGLGVVLIVVSTISTVLAGRPLFGLAVEWLDNTVLLAAAVTLALATVQVFRNDAARADKHRRTAAAFSEVKREIECMLVDLGGECTPPASSPQGLDLSMIKLKLKMLAEESLGVRGSIWRKVDREVSALGREL